MINRATRIEMPMLVLAGGFGTRISKVVSDLPKPLAPVAGRPHLFHMMKLWLDQGVRHFVFLLHYKAETIVDFLHRLKSEGELGDFTFETVIEPEPLGTGGAIAHAVRTCGLVGDFLVTNADTWLDKGPFELSQTAGPAICVVRVENTGRYGRVTLEGERVLRFEEKAADGGPGYINAGMYKLAARDFEDWAGQAFSLESSLLPRLAEEKTLSGLRIDANFVDMGVPEDYFRFQSWIEGGKCGRV